MRYCFDIDGTLCDTPNDENGKPDYLNAKPFPYMVEQVNSLYNDGHYIIMQTARGKGSGIDHTELTKKQLREWGFNYHELFPMFCKPTADIFIDDKGENIESWKRNQPQVRGIIAGSFDIIHPGYARMFKESKSYCNHLTIALHENPSIDRPKKIPPIHTIEERKEILMSIKYIDDVVVYQKEHELYQCLKSGNYHVRFLGDDYMDCSYTGDELDIKIVYINRNHNYSTTELKRKIVKSWR